MKLTKIQYKKLEELMPIARKPAKVSYKFMCAMLYIVENGCKWRALPKKYGKWHTIYVKFRWRSHKKQFESKSKINARNKNIIKFVITSKNFSKTF